MALYRVKLCQISFQNSLPFQSNWDLARVYNCGSSTDELRRWLQRASQ